LIVKGYEVSLPEKALLTILSEWASDRSGQSVSFTIAYAAKEISQANCS
jgi:hypothetical protein